MVEDPSAARRKRLEPEQSEALHPDEVRPEDLPEFGRIGDIRIEASRAFSAQARLSVAGINVRAKRALRSKVSLTLDEPLLEELRSRNAPLSATVNELLYRALEQDRLRTLVEELQAEAGPATPEAYERVVGQWLDND